MIRDVGPNNSIGSAVNALLSERMVALAVVAFALLVMAPPPSPVHVSYVTADSMQPALSPNDGYVVVGGTTIDSGDVITFYSAEQDAHVTHRVVEVTEEGIITKGDNNPTADQAAGAPPVERSQVLGEAVTVGGHLLVVPKVGLLAQALSTWMGRLAVGGVVLLWYLARTRRAAVPARQVTHVRDVMAPMTTVLVLLGLLVLAFSGTTHAVSYEVVEQGASSPDAVTVGESSTLDLTAQVYHPPLTTVIIDTDQLVVTERAVDGSTVRMAAQVPPPSEPGRYQATVAVQPYPSTLPRPWLRGLHQIHPAIAMIVSTSLALVPPVVLSAVLFDWKTPVRTPNWRWLHRIGGGAH